jgi:hypothetical protein
MVDYGGGDRNIGATLLIELFFLGMGSKSVTG